MQAVAETDSGNMGMIVKRVSVPIGLEELMEGLTKEVLLKKPKDLYIFASEYFSRLVILRERNSNHKAYPIRAMQSVTQLKTPNVLNGKKIPSTRPSRHVSRQLSVQNKPPLVTKSNQSEPIRNVIQKSRDRKQDAKKEVAEKQQTTKRERSSSTKDSTPRSTSSVQSTPREKTQKPNSRQVKTLSASEEKKPSKTDKKGKGNKNVANAEKSREANKENLKALSKGAKKAVTERAQEDADKSEKVVKGIEEVKKIEVVKAEVPNDNSENIAKTNEPSLAAADFGKIENAEEVALIKSDAKTEDQMHDQNPKDDKIVEDSLQLEKPNSSGNGAKTIEIRELEEKQTHDETPRESDTNIVKTSDEVRNKESEVEAENEVNNAEKTQDSQTATNVQTIQSDITVKSNDSKDIDEKENIDKADEVPMKIDDNSSELNATSKSVNDDFINIVNTEDNSAALLNEAETVVNIDNSKHETDIATSENDKNSDDQADSSVKLAEGHKVGKEIISPDSDAANKIVDIQMKQMGDSDEILVVSISEKPGPSASARFSTQEEGSVELDTKIDATQEPPVVENTQKTQFFRENKELGSQKNCEIVSGSDQAQNSQVTEQIINYNIAQKQPGRIDSPIKSFLNSFLSSEKQHVFHATASNKSQCSNKGMSGENNDNVLIKGTNIDLEPTNADNIKREDGGVNEEIADENKPKKPSDSSDVPTNDTSNQPGIKNLVFNSVKELLDFNPSDIFIEHERTSSDKDESSDASNNLKLIIKETDSSKTNTNVSSEEPDSVAMLSSKIGGLRNKRSVTGDEIEDIVSDAETKNQNLSQEEDSAAAVKTDTSSSTLHEETGSRQDNTDLKVDSNASNGQDKVQVLSKENHVEDPVARDTVNDTDSEKLGNGRGFSEEDTQNKIHGKEKPLNSHETVCVSGNAGLTQNADLPSGIYNLDDRSHKESAKREYDEEIDKFDKEIVGSLGEGIVDKNTGLVKKGGSLVDQDQSKAHDESIKEGDDKEINKYMSNSFQENVDSAAQNTNLVDDQDKSTAHGESDKKGEDNDIDKNINDFLKGDLDNAAQNADLGQKVAYFVDQDKNKVHEESANKEEDTEINEYSKDISDSLNYATQRTDFVKEGDNLVDQGNSKTHEEFEKQRDANVIDKYNISAPFKGEMDIAAHNADLVKRDSNLVDQAEGKALKESFKKEDNKDINQYSKDIGETLKENTDYATQHTDLVKENANLVDPDESKTYEDSGKKEDYKKIDTYDKDSDDALKGDIENATNNADLVKKNANLVDQDQNKNHEESDKDTSDSPKGDMDNAVQIADLVKERANLVDRDQSKTHEDSDLKRDDNEIDKYDKDNNNSLEGDIENAAHNADLVKENANLVDRDQSKTHEDSDLKRDDNEIDKYDKDNNNSLEGDIENAAHNADLVKENANLVDRDQSKTHEDSDLKRDDNEIDKYDKDNNNSLEGDIENAAHNADLVKENANLVDRDQSKTHEDSDLKRDDNEIDKYDKDNNNSLEGDIENAAHIADLVKENANLVDRDQSKTHEDSDLKRDDNEIDKYDKDNNNSLEGDIENAAHNADLVKENANMVNQDQIKNHEESDKNRNDNEIDKDIGDSLKGNIDIAAQNADLVQEGANLVEQDQSKNHEESDKNRSDNKIDKYDEDVSDSLKRDIDNAALNADLVQEGANLVDQDENKTHEDSDKKGDDKEIDKYDKNIKDSLKGNIDIATQNADLVQEGANLVEQEKSKNHEEPDKNKNDNKIGKYDKDVSDSVKRDIDNAAQNADLVKKDANLVEQDESKNNENSCIKGDDKEIDKYDTNIIDYLKGDIENVAQNADLGKVDVNLVDQGKDEAHEEFDKKEDDKEIDKNNKAIDDSLKGEIATHTDLMKAGTDLVDRNKSRTHEESEKNGVDKEIHKYDTNIIDYLKGDIENVAQNADLGKVGANLVDQGKDEAHEKSDKKEDDKEIDKNNKAIGDCLKGEIATHTDLVKAGTDLVDENKSRTHEESEKKGDDKKIEKHNETIGDSFKGDSDNVAQNADLMEENAKKNDKGINKTYFSEEETGKTASDSVNQQTDNADMPSLESFEGKGISKENTFVKEEAKDQLEGKRRPKIGDIEQVASVIEVVKNIHDSELFTDKSDVAAVGEYLNIFLQNEQNNVFQNNSSIGSRPSDINKKKKSKLTPRAKQERSFSQANLITDEKKTSEVKIKRARSVGVLKARDAESKSKIPTPVRRSAGRRPLVRQLEASSKELEEKLNFKRSSTNDSKEGNKNPTASSKDDALIAKTILTGVKGAEKHIEVIDDHLKKADGSNVPNEPVFPHNNELVEDNQEVKFQSKGEGDEAQKMNEAATKIQKTWKGFNVRRSLEARKGNIDLETNQHNETNPDTSQLKREVKETLTEATQSENLESNIKPKLIEDYEKCYQQPEVSEDVYGEDIVETNQVTKAESVGSKEDHISGIRGKRHTEPHLSDVESKGNEHIKEDVVRNNEASKPTTDEIIDIKKPTVESNESVTASQNENTEIHTDEPGHVSDGKQDSKTNVTSTSIDIGEVKNEVANVETNESDKKEVTIESGHNKEVEKPIIDESSEKIDIKNDEKAETSNESNREGDFEKRIGIEDVEGSKTDAKTDEEYNIDQVKNETSGSNKGGVLTKTSQNEDVENAKESKEAKTHIEAKTDDDFEKNIEISGNEEADTNAKTNQKRTDIDADKNIEGNESNEGKVLIEAMNEDVEKHIEDSGKHIEPAPNDFEKNIEMDVSQDADSDKYTKDNEEKLRADENKDKVNEIFTDEFDKYVNARKDKDEERLIEPNQDDDFEKIIEIKKDEESGTNADIIKANIKTNGSNKEGISMEANHNENIESHKHIDTKANKEAETHVELNRGDDFEKNVEIKEDEDLKTDAKTHQTIESQIHTENSEHEGTEMKPDEFGEHVDAKKDKESETHVEPNTKENEDAKTGVLIYSESSHSANDDKEKAHSNSSLDSTGFNSQHKHIDVKDSSKEAGLEVGITNRIQEVTEAHAQEKAATKIQSAWRGFVVRKMMKHSNAQGKGAQEEAVIKIQAAVRGFLERLKYDKIKADAYKEATGENAKLTEGFDKVKGEETIKLHASNDDVDATKNENAENIDDDDQPKIAKSIEHTSNNKTGAISADVSLESAFRNQPADSTNSEIKESQNQKSVTETEENGSQIMASLKVESDSKAVDQHSQTKDDSDATRNDEIQQVSEDRPNSNGRDDSDNPEVKKQSANKPNFYRSNTVVEPTLVKKASHPLGEDDVNDQKDDNNNSSKEETELERNVRTAVQEVIRSNANLTPLEQEVNQAVKNIMENKSESENDDAKPNQIETILKCLPEVPTNEIPKIIARSVVSEEHSPQEHKSHSVTSENDDASVEIPADDLSSVGSVDSIVTVVLKPKSASQKKPEDVGAEPTSKKLHSKALSTSALEDHVELIDQVQNSLLDQLSGKRASTTNTFDIEHLRKELHDAATLYNNSEDHKASQVDHDAEVMEYLYDFEPEDDEAYETRTSRTPLRELPDIAEEAESKDDDLESASFCKTLSARKQKVIEGKPLDDLVETFDPPIKSREIVISDDNIKIRDNKSLLHTSELHDMVVIPVTDNLSPKENSVKDTSLKHTSEFHDTVVVPLPSGADVKIKNTSTENAVGTSQANLVDNGNQTSTQQPPAGVEVVTSRRRWRDGVDVAGAQAPLKDASPAKPESGGAFTHQSPPQPPRYARQVMESESNNNKRNNAINNSTTDKNMESQAATKIQAGFRGYQVRKQMKAKSASLDQKRQLRKRSSRENIKDADLEEKSAVKIQAGVRGFLVRRRQKKQVSSSASA